MNIPQLPTDNLYKFMAIVGVVVLIVSYAVPYRGILELDRTLAEAAVETAVLRHRAELLRLEAKDQSEEQAAILKEFEMWRAIKNPSRAAIDATNAKMEKLRQRASELRAKQNEWFVSVAQLEGKAAQMSLLLKQQGQAIWALLIGGLVGTVLTVYGFRLWYTRVQVHQDAVIRNAAATAATAPVANNATGLGGVSGPPVERAQPRLASGYGTGVVRKLLRTAWQR